MASSSKKTSKSKSSGEKSASDDVVDAVIVEDEDTSSSTEIDAVDEMAAADGVGSDAPEEEEPELVEEDLSADADEDANPAEPEHDPEPDVEPAPAPVAEEKAASSPFWALVLGGLIAAGLGFALSQYLQPADDGQIEAKLTAHSETIEGLSTQLGEAQSQTEALSGQLGEQTSQITAQSEQIAALEAQIEALTAEVNKPVAIASEAELSAELTALIQQQKDELASLQSDLKSMAAFAEGQIASAQEEADAAAQAEARAKARDSLNVVRLALASGDNFEAALPEIAEAAVIPETLSAVAGGVATQSELQGAFGPAARAALAASNRELSGDSASDRVSLFLQDMIGARSLTPQEGDSPDAVLSRVEAAVRNGDLAGALSTLDALPESGKAELTEWSEKAKARNDALQAFSDLTDALSAD